jgi:hypothetical protein
MAGHGPRRDLAKQQRWRDILRRQKNSGLSIREFCAQHKLTESAFYAWRAEIERRDQSAAADPSTAARQGRTRQSLLAANPPTADQSAQSNGRPRFLPVAVRHLGTTPAVEIALPSGIVLRVGGECDRRMLRAVLGAVLKRDVEMPAC